MTYLFPTEIQELLDGDENPYGTTRNRLDVAVSELEIVYAENFPYYEVLTTTGTKYIWETTFLDKCLVAFATDSLREMNAQELAIWFDYVEYSDAKSTSTDDTVLNAIGCTVIDSEGKSFVVYEDGTISTTIECNNAEVSFPRESLLKSLDNVFEDMLNCREYNTDDTIVGEIENVAPCAI